jgi:predicted dehydrogenase
MSTPRRTVLIGLGHMGRKWAEEIHASEQFSLAALVMPNHGRSKSVKAALGLGHIPDFTAVTEALDSVHADVAIVATPAHMHLDAGLQAISRGIATIIEKPLATDWASAVAIVSEAKLRGVPLLVDMNYRYTGPLATLRRIVQSKEMGEPGFATVVHHRNRKGAGTYQQSMRHAMLLDMAIHHLDTMRFVFQAEGVAVTAREWNPPWSDYTADANFDALLEFGSGLRVTYSGSNAARGIAVHPFANWRIECEGGGIYLDSDGGELELYSVPAESPRGFKHVCSFDPIPTENQKRLLQLLHEWLTNGSVPEVTGEDHLKTLALAMAAIRSVEQGRRVLLSECFTPVPALSIQA